MAPSKQGCRRARRATPQDGSGAPNRPGYRRYSNVAWSRPKPLARQGTGGAIVERSHRQPQLPAQDRRGTGPSRSDRCVTRPYARRRLRGLQHPSRGTCVAVAASSGSTGGLHPGGIPGRRKLHCPNRPPSTPGHAQLATRIYMGSGRGGRTLVRRRAGPAACHRAS